MTDAPTADLPEIAREPHVVVVGGGIAGLVSALECAKIGLRVTLLESAAALGGTIRTAELAGLRLDIAVEGYSPRGGAVRALAEELGLAVASAAPVRPWIAGIPDGAAPFPANTLLGIPENPWDESVRRVIGWSGTWRAYVDRVRPPLTIGQERSLGALVRRRMGQVVLDRLVAPLSLGTYGIHPDDVDVEVAARGLSAALTRAGSLSGAVAELRVDASAPALETIDGGMALLAEALRTRLVELGVDVRTQTRVVALVQRPDERWDAATAEDPGDAQGESLPFDPADAVIVATPEPAARRLLAPHVAALDGEVELPAIVEVVTLVFDAPALDAHPRGDAVHVVPGSHAAAQLVHSTARWPSLARGLPTGTHVVRVSFGTRMAAAATESLDDADAIALARGEAEALLGVPLDIVDARRDRFEPARPASALGHRDAAHAARSAVHAVRGLAATGGWLAGAGLAQVVPDAIAEAERVRRALLWAGDSADG